ncbi:MAG: 50S ribosomal protein L13 [Lentisphaerae bacterium ADurb.BinA184]|nr:MAG: 50S ribosomal protein L13 [Lentisphaerae bacterium ADurb.BinA184]
MKTFLPKEETVERRWVLIDADGQVLGRMAVRIADILRGKDKPVFAPHMDYGDHVIVINASKVRLTGRKEERKLYGDVTGYLGHRRERTAAQIRATKPERLVLDAVWGMMPKGRLGRSQFRKLRVYPGAEHEQAAQKPVKLEL